MDYEVERELNDFIDSQLEQEKLELLVKMFETLKPMVRSVADACFGYIIGSSMEESNKIFYESTGRFPEGGEIEEIDRIIIKREDRSIIPVVGGDIDVAIITHHAGFKWIQHKEYRGERGGLEATSEKD